jgi:ABC-2 type transport system permease protein
MNGTMMKSFLTLPQRFSWIWTNPVVVKEVRTRMRGGRAFILVSAHLLVLGGVTALAYLVFSSSFNTTTSLEERRTFGKVLFGLLVGLELITISFTAPALAAGAIANEHERQTYDLLRVTLLSPTAMVLGKYLSGLTFILLMLFTSLPLLGPAFIVGGVLPQEIIIAVLILLVTAITFCAAGMFFSSLTSRTLFATVLSYAFAIVVVFGLPMVLLFLTTLFSTTIANRVLNGSNVGAISLFWQVFLIYVGWFVVSLNPGAALIASEIALLDQQGVWTAHLDIGNGVTVWMASPWLAFIVINLILSAIFLWLAIRRVKRLEK